MRPLPTEITKAEIAMKAEAQSIAKKLEEMRVKLANIAAKGKPNMSRTERRMCNVLTFACNQFERAVVRAFSERKLKTKEEKEKEKRIKEEMGRIKSEKKRGRMRRGRKS